MSIISEIPRKDTYVTELIDYFDQHLKRYDGNVAAAWRGLREEESKWIDEELLKCGTNDPASVRYFLENYYAIDIKGDENAPPQLICVYPFLTSQEILWLSVEEAWEAKLALMLILLKARQVGWSTIIQGMICQRTIFNRFVKSLILADERVRSDQIFDKTRTALTNMPWWMRPEISIDDRNKGHLQFDRKDKRLRSEHPGLNSNFYIDAANKPTGTSRGFTLQNAHLTEISLYRDPSVISRHVFPAITAHNPLTIFVLEGTAEGINYFFDKLWKAAVAGKIRHRPVFCGWWQQDEYRESFKTVEEENTFTLHQEEKEVAQKIRDVYHVEITPEQWLWHRSQEAFYEATEGDAEMVDQEFPPYPEAAFRNRGKIPWNVKVLKQLERLTVRPPIWWGDIELVTLKDGTHTFKLTEYGSLKNGIILGKPSEAPLWIWETAEQSQIYYCGGDPGKGLPKGNNSAASVWKVAPINLPLAQVAELEGKFDGLALARRMAALGLMYNKCRLAPEINLPTVIEHLLHVIRYANIFRWQWTDKLNKMSAAYGWSMANERIRDGVIDHFKSMMNDLQLQLRSSRCLGECYTFVDNGDGKFEARGEDTDDTLVSNMITIKCIGLDYPDCVQEKTKREVRNPNLDYQNSEYSPIHDGQGPTAGTVDYNDL